MLPNETLVPEAGPGPIPPVSWADLIRMGPPPREKQRIRLKKGGAILLEADGFRLIESRGFRRSTQQAYDTITHLAATDRALLIATDEGLSIIRGSDFLDAKEGEGPEAARQAFLERLAGRPEGSEIRRRIDHLEALSEKPQRLYAIWGLALVCVLFALAQLKDGMVQPFGSFVPELFARGELWRAITGQLIHGAPRFPIHLAMNVAGLWMIGGLVERPLGTLRTILVLAAGGVGTVLGSIYAGYEEVVGASGLVFGLAGAMLALELHSPESLPAYWRIPRRLFIGALIFQFGVIDQFVPVLAGEAHLGGFIGGYAVAWLLGRRGLEDAEPSSLTRAAAIGTLVVSVMGISMAVPLIRHDSEALERHALRLLNSPMLRKAEAVEHNNAVAWFMVSEGVPSPTGVDLAVALASRAVDATSRRDANILDTLAEAYFQSGDRFAAVLTIDEAIQLAPGVRYFEEQRKRFTGERDANDRPEQPGAPESAAGDEEEALDPDIDELIDSGDEPSVVL